MAQSNGLFDNVRQYSSAEFSRIFRALTSAGVIPSIGNNLAITAGPGLGVTHDTGFALILGYFYYSDTSLPLSLDAAHLTLARIDRVVIRLTISAKTVVFAKLTGTPAASPAPPALTQGADVYELPLAQINVPANASSIVSGNITDQRAYAGPTSHDLVTAHLKTGMTPGNVLRAITGSTFDFQALQIADLPTISQILLTTASGAPSVNSPTVYTQFTNTPSITITTTGGKILIICTASLTWVAGVVGSFGIMRGGVVIGGGWQGLGAGANTSITMFGAVIETLAAGTYTYTASGACAGGAMSSNYPPGMTMIVMELKK